MQVSLSLALTQPRSAGGGGAATIAAPFSRVNGPLDGPTAGPYEAWSVYSASGIANDYEYTVSRQGYTTAGATTTYLDTFYVTRQIRQVYPNQASLQADYFANSDYIYSTDTPSGSVTNNSTLISPKPVANWATLARGVVGNTISSDSDPIEVVAFHRNARSKSEVACVIFHISDGTTTIDVTVSSMTESVVPGDRTCVLVYRLPATDITSLNAGVITVNASVYPWIGAAASVLHSSDQSALREFSPRYYQKNTTLAASPWYVCVNATTGNDGAGVAAVSQTQATAEATPALTIQGALKRLTADLGATTGIDGCIILLDDGTHVLSSTGANQTQKIGRVTVTRSSTSASRAACIVQGSAGAVSFQLGAGGTLTAPITTGCIRFKDIRMQRNGIQPWLSGNAAATLELQIEECDYDANGTGGTNALIGANSGIYVNGWTNVAAFPGGIAPSSNGEWRLLRGLNMDLDGRGVENWLVLGSDLNDTSGVSNLSASRTVDGAIVAFNTFRRLSSNVTFTYTLTSGTTINGLVNAYNLYEWTTITSGHSFSISNDSATYGNTHVIEHHNTYIGWEVRGRCNLFYDEGATARTSKLMSCIGNIYVGVYHKGDVFATDGTRIGNWAFLYGVGCKFNAAQYRGNEALGGPQSQVYPGLGTTIGTTWNNASQTVAIDFKFASYAGTTGSPTAGAGGGTYTLLSDSPVKNMVTSPIRPKTLDGVTVGDNDNAGAYSAA
jgi:hypothetical protein